MFLWFHRVISSRIKPKKFFFLVFLVEFQLYFTGFLKVYVTNSSFIEEIFNIKNWKKQSTWVFLQFYEPPDLGKKIFTTWNVLKSEVYLTGINFWEFYDDLNICLEVMRLPSWLENVKFRVKMQFFTFLTPWKISFLINDKFEI